MHLYFGMNMRKTSVSLVLFKNSGNITIKETNVAACVFMYLYSK